jgi:hypothetical protein
MVPLRLLEREVMRMAVIPSTQRVLVAFLWSLDVEPWLQQRYDLLWNDSHLSDIRKSCSGDSRYRCQNP